VIKLGLIAPLTGDAATLGSDIRNGAQLAVDQLNAKGGINGSMVELIAEDGRCNGSDGASAGQKLISVDGVTAIVGGLCSSETLAVAPIAEAAKVVLLSPTSSNPDITTIGTFTFRNYPSDALKTIATAKVVAEKGYKKMAVISENTDFCQGMRTSLAKDLPAGTIVFDEVVDPGTKDFRTLLTRLQGQDIDVFYVNMNSDAVMAAAVQQFRDLGFTQPILSHEVADSTNLGQLAKTAVEGLEFVTVPTAGAGTSFETQFTSVYGAPKSSIAFAAHAYDAAGALLQTMAAQGADGTKVRDALLAMTSYKGVVGDWHFDENGDVVGVPFVLKAFKDGKTELVKPIAL
jgi:branched-chain amino acid transport system substrate-binding protein